MEQEKSLEQMKIAVLGGGVSPEREVSLRSGKACYDALLRQGYDVIWQDLKGRAELLALMEQGVELVFLTTHGTGGEDGRLQGALDWLGLAYTGSSASTSALCMDKTQTQALLQKSGVPVAPFYCPRAGDTYEVVVERLGTRSLFSKPKNGGSSIQSGPLESQSDWDSNVPTDGTMIVERQLKGREITVGVLEQADGWQVLPILELVSHNAFYDYQAKYTEGMTDFIVPAPMDDALKKEVEALAVETSNLVDLSGYGRVDMMLTEDGPFILEVNTLPGMTSTSDLPAMARSMGMDFDDLVLTLLKTGRRHFGELKA